MEMKVYLREAEDTSAEWVDISERCVRPSIRLTEGFSTAGKTGDATELTLTIKALNVTDAAAFHTTEKLVRLSIDGIVVFEGYSNGQATVIIYPGGQLGSDFNVVKKVQNGGVDMEIVAVQLLGAYYPAMDIYSMPFMFPSFPAFVATRHSDFHNRHSHRLSPFSS